MATLREFTKKATGINVTVHSLMTVALTYERRI